MSDQLEDVGLRYGIRRTKLHNTAMNHLNKFFVNCEDVKIAHLMILSQGKILIYYKNNWKVQFLHYITAYTF